MRLMKIFAFFALLVLSSAYSFAAAPTTQASYITFSNVTTTTLTISWTKGNSDAGAGSNYYVGISLDGAFDGAFTDADNYSGVNGTLGANVATTDADDRIVAKTDGNSATVSGLTLGTTYTFKVFANNSTNDASILAADVQTAAGTNNPKNITTLGVPTVQAKYLSFSNVTSTGMTVSWTNGNGQGRLIGISTDGTFETTPPAANYSTADGTFANKVSDGATDFVIGYVTGTTRTINITGLSSNTTYYFKVYEYNGDIDNSPTISVYGAAGTSNPRSKTTSVPALDAPTVADFISATGRTATLRWTQASSHDDNTEWYLNIYSDNTQYTTKLSGYENLDLGTLNAGDADGTIIGTQQEALIDVTTAGSYNWGVRAHLGGTFSSELQDGASEDIVITDATLPTITSVVVNNDNTITVNFSEAAYTDASTGTLTADDLVFTVTTSTGNLTTGDLAVTAIAGTATSRIFSVNYGTYVTGAESIVVTCNGENQIFDASGNPMASSQTATGAFTNRSAHYLSSTTGFYYNTFDQAYTATAAAGTITVNGNATAITYTDDETIGKALTITNAGTVDKFNMTGKFTISPTFNVTLNKLTFTPTTTAVELTNNGAGTLTVTNSTFTLDNTDRGVDIISGTGTAAITIGTTGNANTFNFSGTGAQFGVVVGTGTGGYTTNALLDISYNTFATSTNTNATAYKHMVDNTNGASSGNITFTNNTVTGSGNAVEFANNSTLLANGISGSITLGTNTFNNTGTWGTSGLAVKLTNAGAVGQLASRMPAITLTAGTNTYASGNGGFSTGYYYGDAAPTVTPTPTLAQADFLFATPVVRSTDNALSAADLDDHQTIQAASAASTVSTDYIFVQTGTYNETVTALIGNLYGKASTVLTGTITYGALTAAQTTSGLTFTRSSGNAITFNASASGAFTASIVKDTFNLSGTASAVFCTNATSVTSPITIGGGSTANANRFNNTGSAAAIAFGTTASGNTNVGAVEISYNTFTGASTGNTTGQIVRYVTTSTAANSANFIVSSNTFSHTVGNAVYFSNATDLTNHSAASEVTMESNDFSALTASGQYAIYINQTTDGAASASIGNKMDPRIDVGNNDLATFTNHNTWANSTNGGVYGAVWYGDGNYTGFRADGLQGAHSDWLMTLLNNADDAAIDASYLHIGGGTYAQDFTLAAATAVTNISGASAVIDGIGAIAQPLLSYNAPNRLTLNNGNVISVSGITVTYLDLLTANYDLDNFTSLLVDGVYTYVRLNEANSYPGFTLTKSIQINTSTAAADIASVMNDAVAANRVYNADLLGVSVAAKPTITEAISINAPGKVVVLNNLEWLTGVTRDNSVITSGTNTSTVLSFKHNTLMTDKPGATTVNLSSTPAAYTSLFFYGNTIASTEGTGVSVSGSVATSFDFGIAATAGSGNTFTNTTSGTNVNINTTASSVSPQFYRNGFTTAGTGNNLTVAGTTFTNAMNLGSATAGSGNTFTTAAGTGYNVSLAPSVTAVGPTMKLNTFSTGANNNVTMTGTYTGTIQIGGLAATENNSFTNTTANSLNLNLTAAAIVNVAGNAFSTTTGSNVFMAGTYSGAVTIGGALATSANTFISTTAASGAGGTGLNLTGTYNGALLIAQNTFNFGTNAGNQDIGIRLGTTGGASIVLGAATHAITSNTFNMEGDDAAYNGTTSVLGTGGDIGILIDTDGGSASLTSSAILNFTTNTFAGTTETANSRAAIVFWGADQTNNWRSATVNFAAGVNAFTNDGFLVYATKGNVATIANSTFPDINIVGTVTDGGTTTDVTGYYMQPNTATGLTGTPATKLVTRPTITVNGATTPSTLTFCAGTASAVTSTVNTTGSPTIQWQVSTNSGTSWANQTVTVPYSTVTAASLTIASSATTAETGKQFRVVYTGTLDTAISTVVTLNAASSAAFSTNLTSGTIYGCAATDKVLTVNTTNATTYDWEVSTDNGSTWNDISIGADYSTTSSLNTSSLTILGANIAAKMTGLYRYRVNISGACVTPVASNVSILTNSNTPAVTGYTGTFDDQLCEGASGVTFTIIGTVTNSSEVTAYTWQKSTDGGTTWTTLANGGDVSGATTGTLTIANATFANTYTGANVHRYRINNMTTICGITANTATTTTSATTLHGGGLNINNRATAPAIGATVTSSVGAISTTTNTSNICDGGTTTVTISAAAPSDGTWLKWEYSKNSGGLWSDISGITADGVTSVTSSATLLTLVGLTNTNTGYWYRTVYTVAGSTCSNVESAHHIVNFISAPTTSPITSSTAVTICSGTGTTITTAAGGTSYTTWVYRTSSLGAWNDVVVGSNASGAFTVGSEAHGSLVISSATTTASGYQFATKHDNGSCTATYSATPATLTVTAQPTASVTGAVNVCSTTASNTITATTTNGSSYSWTRNGGGALTNGADYSGATTASLTVNNTSLIGGTFVLTVTNGSCTAQATQVVTVVTAPAAKTIPNTVTACAGNTITINATGTGTGTHQWKFSTDGGTTYSNVVTGAVAYGTVAQDASTLTITGVTVSANGYKFKQVWSNSPCTDAESNVCTVGIDLVGATIATPSAVCAGANLTLTSTGGTGVGTWQYSSNSGATWNTVVTVAGKFTLSGGVTSSSLVLTGVDITASTYQFRRNHVLAPCTDQQSNVVTITVNAAPTVATASGTTTICPAAGTTFSAAGGTNWTTWVYRTSSVGSWNNVTVGVLAGKFTVTVENSTTLTLTSVDATATGYEFATEHNNGTCSALYSNAVVLTVSSPVASTVSNQSTCATGSVTFTATGGTGTHSEWQYWNGSAYVAVPSSGSFGTPTIGTVATNNATTLTITGVTTDGNSKTFRTKWVIGSCEATSATPATLTVSNPVASTLTSPVAACEASNITITANTGSAVGTFTGYEYSSNSGTTWNDMNGTLSAIAASYTEAAGSLTLTNVAATANNYQFRAVYTSGSCTAYTTTPATITVNALPTNITLTTTTGTMVQGSTGTVTIPSSQSGVTYTVKSGATTVGTGTGTGSNLNITISHASLTTAGSPYTLTIDAANTCSRTLTSTFAMTVTAGSSTPTKLSVATISTQTSATSFTITVNSRDAGDALANVTSNTGLTFTTSGAGILVVNTATPQIASGSNSATVSLTYTAAAGESNVTITASAIGLTSGVSNAFTVLAAAPTTQASNISFSGVGQFQMTLSFTAGNGTGRMVVANSGSSVTLTPTNGATYTASAAYAGANSIVARGAVTGVTVTGLTNNTKYAFKVFEFNGSSDAVSSYMTADGTGNPKTKFTNPKLSAETDENNIFSNNVSSAYPNPVKDEVSFDLELNETSLVTVDVYSETGEHIGKLVNQTFNGGMNTMSFKLPELITNGTYSVIITIGNEVHLERIVVTK